MFGGLQHAPEVTSSLPEFITGACSKFLPELRHKFSISVLGVDKYFRVDVSTATMVNYMTKRLLLQAGRNETQPNSMKFMN